MARQERDAWGRMAATSAIHSLLVSSANVLYHLAQSNQSPTGWLSPAPICQGVQAITAIVDDDDEIEAFAVGTVQNALTHLTREALSTNWQVEPVEVQAGGIIEDFVSYSSDVTLYDQVGVPLVNTEVLVWSAEKSRLPVNGGT